MEEYKNYPILGRAVRGDEMLWHSLGLVFAPERPIRTIKCLECADIVYTSGQEAEEYALILCKAWIDRNTTHLVEKVDGARTKQGQAFAVRARPSPLIPDKI